MAYVQRRIPPRLDKNRVTMTFGDLRGVDFRQEETAENRTPNSVNMMRNAKGEWETHTGFFVIGTFPAEADKTAPVCYGCEKFSYIVNGKIVTKVVLHAGDKLYTWDNYQEENNTFSPANLTCIFGAGSQKMNRKIAKYAIFDNKLLIVDGQNYLVYDGTNVKNVYENAFIPQTWRGKEPNGAGGTKYQQVNLLQPKFMEGFIGDGTSTVYQLSLTKLDSTKVEARIKNGTAERTVKEGAGLSVDREKGIVTFQTAPEKPNIAGTDNVFILAAKTTEKYQETICNCNEMLVFDNRIFLTGNADKPNNIYWCGYNDFSYFGEIMYSDKAGTGSAPVRALQLLSADSFLSIKDDTAQDGSYTVWQPIETNENYNNKVYVGKQGNGTLGVLSNHTHTVFIDDNLFLSNNGLNAVSRNLNISNERNIEHRSTLIDGKLLLEDLQKATMEQFGNNLYILLPNGNCYVANGLAKCSDISPYIEYEWAFLQNIGTWRGQYLRYVDENGTTTNPPEPSGAEGGVRTQHVLDEYIGGVFESATFLRTLGDKELYFGGVGVLCKFHFDKLRMDSVSELQATSYHFNGRHIGDYVDTSFSWFQASNRYKKLINYWNDLYLTSRAQSCAQVVFRTENTFISDSKVLEFNSGYFDFNNIDFDSLTFNTLDNVSFALKKLKAKLFRKLQVRVRSAAIFRPIAFQSMVFEAEIIRKKLK
ncbi:MAG: hypothetical protein RR292_06915 [Christensenellaceae bacterium]